MFFIGFQIDFITIAEYAKKPVGIFCSLISHMFITPLFTLLIAKCLIDNNYIAFGLLITGCCPSGLMSNFWNFILQGDKSLGVSITFISTLTSTLIINQI